MKYFSLYLFAINCVISDFSTFYYSIYRRILYSLYYWFIMDSIESSSTCNSSSTIPSAWNIQPALDSISSNIPQLVSSLHNAQSYVIVAILGLLIIVLASFIYFTLRKSDLKSTTPTTNIAIVEASLIPDSNENPSLLNEVKEECLEENKFQSSSAVCFLSLFEFLK